MGVSQRERSDDADNAGDGTPRIDDSEHDSLPPTDEPEAPVAMEQASRTANGRTNDRPGGIAVFTSPFLVSRAEVRSQDYPSPVTSFDWTRTRFAPAKMAFSGTAGGENNEDGGVDDIDAALEMAERGVRSLTQNRSPPAQQQPRSAPRASTNQEALISNGFLSQRSRPDVLVTSDPDSVERGSELSVYNNGGVSSGAVRESSASATLPVL